MPLAPEVSIQTALEVPAFPFSPFLLTGAACPLGAGRRSNGGLISAVFQACLDREIQSGSIGTGLAARYHFPKHFEQIPVPGSRCFSPLQPRVFLRSVPKSQYSTTFAV
jgi:hypothetical protein